MTIPQFKKTDLHKDLFIVGNTPKDKKKAENMATGLRNKTKREDEGMTVHTRQSEDGKVTIYLATSDDGRKALPTISGRGKQEVYKVSDLLAGAK